MKKSLLALVAISVVASGTLSSCKKGENDPFLSLRTRKARLVSDWKLKDGHATRVQQSNSSGVTTTTNWTFTEDKEVVDYQTFVVENRIDEHSLSFKK